MKQQYFEPSINQLKSRHFRVLTNVLALFQLLLFIAMPWHMASSHHSLAKPPADAHIVTTSGGPVQPGTLATNIVTTEDNHCLLSFAAHFGGTASLQAAAGQELLLLTPLTTAGYTKGPFKNTGILAIAPKHSPPSA